MAQLLALGEVSDSADNLNRTYLSPAHKRAAVLVSMFCHITPFRRGKVWCPVLLLCVALNSAFRSCVDVLLSESVPWGHSLAEGVQPVLVECK